MTPFRNDAENPFDRDTPWPRMPQSPLGFRRLADGSERPWPSFETLSVGRPDEDDHLGDEELVWFDSCPDAFETDGDVPELEDEPEAEAAVVLAPARPTPAPRRAKRRLAPLIGATAVGVGGLLALFLLIGVGPDPSTAQASPVTVTAQAGR